MEWSDDIKYLKGVGPKKAEMLRKLGISTLYGLLCWFPRSYEDQSILTPVSELKAGELATVSGTIMGVQDKQARRNMSILTAMVSDGSGYLQVTWFNQSFLKKKLKTGKRILVTGKTAYAFGGQGELAMSQLSSYQILDEDEKPESLLGIQPIYSATEKLNQKFFRNLVMTLFENPPELKEVLPSKIRAEFGLMQRQKAFAAIHFPKNFEEIKEARRRLAFEELYLIQCGLLLIKKHNQSEKRGVRHISGGNLVKQVLESLPWLSVLTYCVLPAYPARP